MDIRPELRQAQQPDRKRQLERSAAEAPAQPAEPQAGDRAEVQLDPAAAERYVDLVKQHDPGNLHRIEDLKARIAGGEYSATPEELADRLLEALDRGALD